MKIPLKHKKLPDQSKFPDQSNFEEAFIKKFEQGYIALTINMNFYIFLFLARLQKLISSSHSTFFVLNINTKKQHLKHHIIGLY